MAIAHTHTEQTSSPAITDSTIQWACQKRWNRERLDDVSGATDEEMSAGFMERPFRRSRPNCPADRDQDGYRDRSRARTRAKGPSEAAASRTPTDTQNFTTTQPARHRPGEI